MEIKNYISSTQSVLNRILINSKKRGSFPQAILLNCELEMPSMEISKFIAKSLICDDLESACLTCDSCLKIENDNYLNLVTINGEEKNISKEEIENLIHRFSIHSVDEGDVYVYIINLIERTSKEAINAILKFLEEPLLNVHAIITTKNISKVLPTIISRCEVINLLPIKKEIVIENSISNGVSKEDAEILSYFYVNEDKIKEFSISKEYVALKSATISFLEAFTKNQNKARFILETEVLDTLKNDNLARFFFDLVTIFLKEAINNHFGINHILKSYSDLLKNLYNKLGNIDSSIFRINEVKNNLDLNINKTLLLEQLNTILRS